MAHLKQQATEFLRSSGVECTVILVVKDGDSRYGLPCEDEEYMVVYAVPSRTWFGFEQPSRKAMTFKTAPVRFSSFAVQACHALCAHSSQGVKPVFRCSEMWQYCDNLVKGSAKDVETLFCNEGAMRFVVRSLRIACLDVQATSANAGYCCSSNDEGSSLKVCLTNASAHPKSSTSASPTLTSTLACAH
jgi:hypothetical protein